MLASIERGSGPAVVLLHGQPGSGSSWDPVTEAVGTGLPCPRPDRIGYGASVGEAKGLADNAELVAALIRAKGVRRRPPWWPTAGPGVWACCWRTATRRW